MCPHLPRLLLLLPIALATACGRQPENVTPATTTAPTSDAPPPRSTAPPTTAPTTTAAPSAAAPRPLPATTTVHVHLPGPDEKRHLNVRVDIGKGPDWFIEGCTANLPGACAGTHSITLRPEDRAAYVELWNAIFTMPRCEPNARPKDARLFQLDGPAGHFEDPLPKDVAQIPASTQGPCQAPARLAVWVAQRFGALP